MIRDTLAVVISYNNAEMTKRAVYSLMDQTHPVEVVVWDNNSPDKAARELSRQGFPPQVTIVSHDENLLWSPAVNKAIELYGGGYEYIMFMNNDVVLPNNVVEEMRETASVDSVGMVGPLANGIGGPQDIAFHPAWTESDDERPKSRRVTYLIGACILMRKSVWDITGGLDNEMPLGGDDHYQSIMIKQSGYEIRVQDNVVAQHDGHASGSSDNWLRYGATSWKVFDQKLFGYYKTEQEANMCHWDGEYHEGWEVGTGWMTEEESKPIWEKRGGMPHA